jgi:hypothetical protein
MIRIRGWLAVGVLLLLPLSLLAEESVIPDPEWKVARAQFTSAIRNREPVDRLVVATPFINEVYFFTDLRHLEGRTITHRWEYEGRVVSQVPFKVGGPRWRVNSKKEIEPEQVGDWSVTVIDESGWPLYTELFRYENGAPLLLPLDAQPVAPVAGSGGTGRVMNEEQAPPESQASPQGQASQQDSGQSLIPASPAAGSGVSE